MSTETPPRRSRFRWIPLRSGRSKVIAGLTALAVPFAAMVGLATPAAAATSATATYTKKSDWGSGFEGQWTVKNTGTTALSSWTIEWDYPAGTRVNSAWDATVTSSGNRWTAKNLGWNGNIAPGASVSFGFNGSGPGAPTGCKLNGASCDGSTVPGDNPPTAPGTPTTSDVTNTSVKLSWSAATDDKGVKNYDVLRNGAKIATVTGTTYTNTGLTAGTDYTYAVQARDTIDQLGPVSGSVSVRTTGGGGGEEPPPGDKINLGYFTNWGVYGRNYHVKNLVTSGTAAKITHINYAFGNVQNGKCTDAIAKLKAKGVPAKKLLLGIGFYGRGWTGVTQAAPGGTATGAAPGTYEAGIEDYKVLKSTCPATGTIAGTAYAHCGTNWWSYDTPATIGSKMTWAKSQGLGGAFSWEFSGDTTNGELVSAISNGLK
ncbi:cellulose binding domain-containing protein [Streptomyces sp. MT29]|nr:cellulose binding domain-containing protein [Streptomyces sp. MT29]